MKRVFPANFLLEAACDIFEACGTPPKTARIVSEHLINANLMGTDSHGVIRVPQYVNDIRMGLIVGNAPIRVLHETDTTAVVDAGWNFGQVGAMMATDIAVDKAKKHGLASVSIRRSRHVGCLGMYPLRAAEQDLIGMAMCGSAGAGLRVCPWGGRDGRLATNPIAFAAPTNSNPIMLDFSTSTASEGKIRLMLNRDEYLPECWLVDANGRPSRDPRDLYGSPTGAILPLGGSQGYKGFALSLMAQILAGLLGQPPWRKEGLEAEDNVMWMLVIDIASFVHPDHFRREMDDLVAFIRSSDPAEGFNEIVMPGELNFREMEQRSVAGIPVDDETWRQIEDTAAQLGIELAPETVLNGVLSEA